MDSWLATLLIILAAGIGITVLVRHVVQRAALKEEERQEKVAQRTAEEWNKAVARHRATTSGDAPDWRSPGSPR